KRHVNGVDLQSGKTYSNLVIHGGIRAIWTRIDNVTFIDCDFVDAQTHVTVQLRRDSSDSADNWRFIRCSFTGATRDDWGHAHGVFLEHVGTFTFEDCVFQDNGWLYGPGNSKGRFNQNHHVYLVNVGNVTFDRCSFNRASAQGIKARGFWKLV